MPGAPLAKAIAVPELRLSDKITHPRAHILASLSNFIPGFVLSISLLLAAGLAVYENPHVKQWVDESRRKIAIALHSLGDDVEPSPSSHRRTPSEDASMREDTSAEAIERRRKARQEILDRGRMMEERRKARQASSDVNSRSFDDIVDKEGNLKYYPAQATTSAAEPQPEQSGLRNRNLEAHGAALGTAFGNPFADEAHLEDLSSSTAPLHRSTLRSRSSSTATLPASSNPPPVPPKEPLDPVPSQATPQAPQQPRLLIDTDDISNHPSEALVNLTPTTSVPSLATDLSELDHHSYPSNNSQTNFWSVHEWAENNTGPAQFYTPPISEAAVGDHGGNEEDHLSNANDDDDDQSDTGTGELVSRVGSMSDMDVMSVVSGVSTPSGWTEMGSQVSEDF
ncbi:MAG: hypothetical protein Q9220_003718 [cf. Caloplaca sp. 1 TL-2023]